MNKRANKWSELARYLAGEMDMLEEMEYRKTIENNNQHISDLKAMEETWKHFHAGTPGTERNTGEAWSRLQKKLREDGLLGKNPVGPPDRQITPFLRVAAVILLLLAVGGPLLWFGVKRNVDKYGVETHMAARGVNTVDLPDGSRIFLNQDAEISYPSDFEQNRTVKLNGEAFFEVMSDPVNPFTVRSGNVVVSVLGTSFNVRQSDRSPEVEVFVETGRVRMSVENSGQFITLEEGEMGRTEATQLTRTVQEDPNYIAWKTKDFKFVNAELDRVIGKLEEAYHVEIIAENADLRSLRLTSTYSEQSIDAILETIATAFGMTLRKEQNTYYLINN
ncbi:MAG TPA: DUF4974 domain-containing protein [Bacteroides sp.]|nr:DUF4974 domain-containing protein [Bacteroides sp.]